MNELKRYQAKFWKRKYEKERSLRLCEEDFIEQLKSILSTIKPLPPLTDYVPKGSHKPHEAVLLFSDSQIGEKVQSKETGFWDYNLEVFQQELRNLYVAINNIVGIHRNDYRVDKLNIFFLGDLVEGTGNIYRGQGARIVTDVVEQAIDIGLPEIARFIQGLATNFKEIYITGVVGNHGRLRRRGEDLTYVNWDYVIMKMLEHIVGQIPNVKCDITKTWWKIVEVQGWKFYLEHGDQLIRYMQIPWYSMERRDGKLTLKHQARNEMFHYYCIGHHHEPFEWIRPEGERICNGTFVGGNALAGHRLATVVHPIQKLFFVHPEMGKVCSYNIRLDPPREYVK